MRIEGLVWKAYFACVWIMRLVCLNLLWLLFILAGLAVLGFFPATAAMFAVTRKWVMGETDIPIFKTFWKNYKIDFVQTNLIGYGLLLIGAFLYVDLRFSQTAQQFVFQSFSFIFIILLFIYFIVLLYIFPVFVHFQFKTFAYIKQSFIIAVGRPIQSIMMFAGCVIVYFILRTIPIIVPFFSGSLMSIVIMWIAFRSFPKEEV